MDRYTTLQDSISLSERKAIDASVLHLLNEVKQQEMKKKYYLLILIILIITGAIFLYISYKKQQYKSNKKSTLIAENEKKVLILEQKINESYEEILQMAKNNDPHFWSRFREVYPNFSENLLEINPKLTVSELTLGAYISLGFTTKEIAEITVRAFKTVENTRYNLRKKLQLETDTNLQTWLTVKMKK